MKKTFARRLIAAAALALGFTARAHTQDVAFGFRMPVGFPGDVTRSRPFSIYPTLGNTSVQAPRLFGDALFVNTADSTVRGAVAADGSATPAAIYGVAARPYPFQQQSGGPNATIGVGAPPSGGIIDVVRLGVVVVKLPAGASVTKGGTVYVWAAATSGNNIQGGFVAAASSTNTLPVTNAKFLGPADANGYVELEIWPG